MKDKFTTISILTTFLLLSWIAYELYENKNKVENSELIETINPVINTDILNSLKSKYYF